MHKTCLIRSFAATCAFFLVWLPIASADDQVVAGSRGGSYFLNLNGDQVASVTNDDGSVIQYHYDFWGNQSGMTVTVDGVPLTLDYEIGENGSGWVYAAPLPPLAHTVDEYGRTLNATLYPGTWFDNGEWSIDVNSPPPIQVASVVYAATGHLNSITLNSGLSMEMEKLEVQTSTPWAAPAPSGLVSQSLYGSDGTLLASALLVGGTNVMRVAPTQLDAVATQLGWGANWAQTLVFTPSASGQVTTARNAMTGAVVLYIVDAGPFRVGYTPDGTAVFYDLSPTYGVGDDPGADPATQLAGIAPTQIVMMADGATGMYNDRPAEGAVYGVWNDAAGAAHYGRLTSEPDSVRRMASQSSMRAPKIGTNAFVRHKTTVCVNDYCWTNEWYEWVEDGSSVGGAGPPAGGGPAPAKTGNNVNDPKLRAATDRALNKAKQKLQNQNCLALFNRTGKNGKTLIDEMRARQYTAPGAYLTKFLRYETGNGSKDCPGDAKASTTVYGSRVAICRSFGNSPDGWNAVYLIHEMMHTLGQGEAPAQGQPTSSQLNQDVNTACGH